jgi:hypothetical protein
MRQGITQFAGAAKGLAASAALLALSGCGGGGYIGSLLGSGPSSDPVPSQAAQASAPAGRPVGSPTELVCPYVDVREGAAAHRVYAGQPSSAAVRYQISMGEIARECRVAGNQLILRIGVEGRVLLGPSGAPGAFTVPVTIAVRDEQTRQYVASRTYRVAASIAQGAANTSFAAVSDEIALPLKSLGANEDYLVFVGFDGASAATGSQRSRRR